MIIDNMINRVKQSIKIIVIIGIVSLVTLIISGVKISEYSPDIGSLVGGTLGGLGTLIAILFTLKDSASKFNEQQHEAIKPFLNAWHLCGAVNCNDYKEGCSIYDLLYDPINNTVSQKVNYNTNHAFCREIVIENIGLGAATNISIEIKKEDSFAKLKNTFSLAKDKSTIRRFILPLDLGYHSCISILDKCFGEYSLILIYEDMKGLEYKQIIKMTLVEDSTVDKKINLQDFIEISIPEKM